MATTAMVAPATPRALASSRVSSPRRVATTSATPARTRRTPLRDRTSRSRRSLVISNFSPAAGDFSFSAPEGAAAGGIVLGARVLLIGLAKAGIGRRVEKYAAKCEEYGISIADLYHVEDQPGDAWYLVGDWKPAKAGDPKHSDTTLVGIIQNRCMTHEVLKACEANGVDVSDVRDASYVADFIKNEKMRFVEARKRLEEATGKKWS